MAAAGQVSWPPAGSYMAASGQFLAAVVTGCKCMEAAWIARLSAWGS
jgi:hypothetical protein